MRILTLCTHNSARSQMAEGWLRHYAHELELNCEIFSAGTEKTFVKPDAITVMHEIDIDISNHTSKTLEEIPNATNFDVVLTVCDAANESCPAYLSKTTKLHISFPDPSGKNLDTWRDVRDNIGHSCKRLITLLKNNDTLSVETLLDTAPSS